MNQKLNRSINQWNNQTIDQWLPLQCPGRKRIELWTVDDCLGREEGNVDSHTSLSPPAGAS